MKQMLQMTIEELVSDLHEKRVRLWLEGTKLKYDAPDGIMTAELLTALRRRRNQITDFLSRFGQVVPPPHNIPSAIAGPATSWPLSFAQERMWFLDQLTPNSPFFNLALPLRIEGPLNVEILQKALVELVARHESLRTVFAIENDKPVQVVTSPQLFRLEVHTSSCSLQVKLSLNQDVRRLIAQEARKPFNLQNGPLFRAALFEVDQAFHLLILTMHHIVCDGWSLGILLREVSTLYNSFAAGKPSPLPALPVQYRNFAIWQRDRLRDETFTNQLRYWVDHLQGLEPLQLMPGRPRPGLLTYKAAKYQFVIPRTLTQSLIQRGQQQGATLFMTLLAGFVALIARYSDRKDIAVAVPIANRNRLELEDLIGFFVNTLVMRIAVEGNPSISELLHNVKTTALQAYMRQDVPFERLVAELSPQRELDRNPLVQVMFALQNAPIEALQLTGLGIRPLPVPHAFSHFDLELHFWTEDDGLRGVFVYSTDLFDGRAISSLAAQLRRVLNAFAASPGMLLSALPVVSKRQRRRLLTEYSRCRIQDQTPKCIHSLFEEQALRTPDRPAVKHGRDILTFGELDAHSNRLAHYLIQKGVTAETPVGVCVTPSLEMIIGLLGILKAGGAYVPLDPNWPAERLRFVLRETKARISLTQIAFVESLSCMGLDEVFCLERGSDSLARESVASVSPQALPEHLAYIIYTSGSSGIPKGVMMEHRAVSNLLTGIFELFYRDYSEGANTTLLASFTFDASVEEIFASLAFGHCLCIVPDEAKQDGAALLRFLADNEIDICCGCSPAHLSQLTEAAAEFGKKCRLKHLVVGGEALEWRTVREFFHNWTGETMPTLFNIYGPTECCVDVTAYCLNPLAKQPRAATVPIGKPLANTRVYVVDRFGDLTPIGVPGELCVGGAGLARGYLQSPQLTAEKFVRSQFAPHKRIYRTGDLVRWLPSRDLEFLGRRDTQVQIRGFRVEPGEIDCLLAEHPAVRQSITIARETEAGEKQLVSYIASAAGHHKESHAAKKDLRNYLQDRLPAQMVPAVYVFLERMPLTPNGKIDRTALPEPRIIGSSLAKSSETTITATERALLQIWSRVFKHDVDISDNFFELGGHSLLATRLVSMIRSTLGINITLREFFAAPCISELGACIDEKHGESDTCVQSQQTRFPGFNGRGQGS
jgi:amino acid adenylation domain-containing protein